MATEIEQSNVREFIAATFQDENGNFSTVLLTEWVTDLVYGDVSGAAKEKYKLYLQDKIGTLDGQKARLDTEKQEALNKLAIEKAEKQIEIDKLT